MTNRSHDNGSKTKADIEAALAELQRQVHGASTRLEAFRPSRNGYRDDGLEAQISQKIQAVEGALQDRRADLSPEGADRPAADADRVAEIQRLTGLTAALREQLDTMHLTLTRFGDSVSAEDLPAVARALAGVTTSSAAELVAAPAVGAEQATAPGSDIDPDGDTGPVDVRLSTAKERYADARKKKIAPKTLNSHRQAIDDLIAIIGDKPVAGVARGDIVAYRNILETRPSDRGDGDVLDYDTVFKNLSHIRSFFKWAQDNHVCAGNPASDVKATKPSQAQAPEEERPPFTPRQLQTLLDAPLFTGCKHAKRVHVPGEHIMNYDARYWYPLLVLFAGLRPNEIDQLQFEHIVTHQDVRCFDVCRNVKTKFGRRLVPIHSKLIELGFLEWVEYRRENAEDDRIFPQYKYERFVNESLLGELGLKKDGLVLYSLRHTFADRIDGVHDKAKDRVMGHAHKHERGRYGSADITAKQMEVVEAATFDDIDFSKLVPFPGRGEEDS